MLHEASVIVPQHAVMPHKASGKLPSRSVRHPQTSVMAHESSGKHPEYGPKPPPDFSANPILQSKILLPSVTHKPQKP